MRPRAKATIMAAASVLSFAFGMSVTDGAVAKGEGPFAAAHAVVGRPATPVSYAGVARRTTRRTVAATSAAASSAAASSAAASAAAASAAAQPTVVIAPPPAGCVQIVDQSGNVTTRCP